MGSHCNEPKLGGDIRRGLHQWGGSRKLFRHGCWVLEEEPHHLC